MARNIYGRNCFFKIPLHLRRHRRNMHAGSELNCKYIQSLEKDGEIITILELRERYMKIRGVEPGFTQLTEDRSYLLQYLPKTQEELPPRSIKESFQRAIIPLSTHPQLQVRYGMNAMGWLRIGRLLEESDMFSDWVAINYIKNPKQPDGEITSYAMVTILVDQIAFTEYCPRMGLDVLISGYVSSVGKTTIETTIFMDQIVNGVPHRITKAIFLMAARNAVLTGGAVVNPLLPANEEEKRILAESEVRKRQRIARQKESFMSQMPTQEEQQIVHQMFLESTDTTISSRVLPADGVWMADTLRSNNVFSFTEDRNFNNTVFGGFLIRNATEMAWFTAYFHCQHNVKERAISDIVFKHPVPLGAIISFNGRVVYTEGRLMEVFIHGDVHDPRQATNFTSFVTHFTYESPEPVKRVEPNTYYEAMMFIDGRRHFIEVMNPSCASA